MKINGEVYRRSEGIKEALFKAEIAKIELDKELYSAMIRLEIAKTEQQIAEIKQQ